MASIVCIQRFAPALLVVLLPSAALWLHDDANKLSSDAQCAPSASQSGGRSTGVFVRPDATMSEILPLLPDEDCTFAIDSNTGELSVQTARSGIPHLDILPGICPNRFKVERGGDEAPALVAHQLSTGILGNGFDVTQTDLGSLQLTRQFGNAPDAMFGVNLSPTSFTFVDKATPFLGPMCECHSLGADGAMDLIVEFDEPSIIQAFQLQNEPDGAVIVLTVFGRTSPTGGFRIRDCITLGQ